MLKRVLFVLCIVILVAAMVMAAINIIEYYSEPHLENDIFPTLPLFDVIFPWVWFVCMLFEILYNIMYFLVYKASDMSTKARLNIASLIVCFSCVLCFIFPMILVLWFPFSLGFPLLLALTYMVMRIIYFVLAI